MRRDDRRWLWLPFIGVDEYYPCAVRVDPVSPANLHGARRERLEASLNLEEWLHTCTIISGEPE
jgi:hypothetical protein